MKKETLKKKKFNLDKFEVVKLSGIKNIKGGNGVNEDTVITSGTHNDGGSSASCKMSVLCN